VGEDITPVNQFILEINWLRLRVFLDNVNMYKYLKINLLSHNTERYTVGGWINI
jgi:hypothetical protein